MVNFGRVCRLNYAQHSPGSRPLPRLVGSSAEWEAAGLYTGDTTHLFGLKLRVGSCSHIYFAETFASESHTFSVTLAVQAGFSSPRK